MLRFVALGLTVLLLQGNVIRADFGIPTTFNGVAYISTQLSETKQTLVDATNAYNTLVTADRFPWLTDAATALKNALDAFITNMTPFLTAMETAVSDNVGPIETTFQNMYTAIQTIVNYLENDYPPLLQAVQTKVSTDVYNELHKFATLVLTTVGQFQVSFSNLATVLKNARTAASSNGNVYSTAIKTQYITPSVVLDVQAKVAAINAHSFPVQFSASETYRTVTDANDFANKAFDIIDGTELEDLVQGKLDDDYSLIDVDLTLLKNLIASEIPITRAKVPQFATTYNALAGTLTTNQQTVSDVYDGVALNGENALIEAYDLLYDTFEMYYDDFASTYFEPVRPLVIKLATMLVQRIKNADFCYAVYEPKIMFYLTLMNQQVGQCFDIELYRLDYLRNSIIAILEEMEYFLEDIYRNMEACDRLTLSPTYEERCLNTNILYADRVSEVVVEEYEFLLELLVEELEEFVYRLWSCIIKTDDWMDLDVAATTADIDNCLATSQAS